MIDFDFGTGPKAKEKQHDRFRFFSMADMKETARPVWLIRDLIMEQQIGCAYAPPGSLKSFLALALASTLVHGGMWQGRNLKPCNVVYVAGEGFPMFYQRRLAWFKHASITPPDDDGLKVVNGAFSLLDSANVVGFIDAMRKNTTGVKLIIFDTLSTFTAGEDESDSGVMSGTIAGAKTIGAALGCAILFVHHPGKDPSRGARGHSSLLGNIDTEWTISRLDATTCTLKVTKQKDAEDGQTFWFTAHRIPLGIHDEDGGEMSSLALAPRTDDPVVHGGTAIPLGLADRISIASCMTIGVPLSRNKLATQFRKMISRGRTVALDRITAALTPEWQRCRRGASEIVELRCLEAPSGKPAMVEMRAVVPL